MLFQPEPSEKLGLYHYNWLLSLIKMVLAISGGGAAKEHHRYRNMDLS